MALRAYGLINTSFLMPQSVKLVQKANGLSEGEASFQVVGVQGSALVASLPPLGTAHPYSSNVWMESRVITWMPDGIRADCRYAGAEVAMYNIPQYELVLGMDEQPIETHPNFSGFAGTAELPTNGALFIDADTGQIGTDNATAYFDRFLPSIDGAPNPFAGLEAYLSPTVTYRENYVSNGLPSSSGFGTRTTSVPGPGFSVGGRDWLYLGFTYRRRGNPAGGSSVVYEVAREWRLSGRGGWNDDVYA